MKNRFVVVLLAFLLGFLGVHRFYLGQHVRGILYIITIPISGFIALYDAIVFLTMSKTDFDIRYNLRRDERKLFLEQQRLERELLVEERKHELERSRFELERRKDAFKEEIEETRRQKKKVSRMQDKEVLSELQAWQELYREGVIDHEEYLQRKEQLLYGEDNNR